MLYSDLYSVSKPHTYSAILVIIKMLNVNVQETYVEMLKLGLCSMESSIGSFEEDCSSVLSQLKFRQVALTQTRI